MEQRARGVAGHARITVGRARRHTLEENRNGTHPRFAVEGIDEMDLARSRIGETEIDARFHERAEQAFRAVQRSFLLNCRRKTFARFGPVWPAFFLLRAPTKALSSPVAQRWGRGTAERGGG